MKNERKLLKARKRRADFEKKRNIKNNNWPAGNSRRPLSAGDGILPTSKKTTLSRKAKATRATVRRKAIKTATNN
jgi:hypothetical protein